MMIQAVGHYIIVRLHYADKMRGVVVPDQAKLYEGDYWGEVISIGDEVSFRHEVKPGDKIIYLRNEGYRIYDGMDVLYAVNEKWIGGKIE